MSLQEDIRACRLCAARFGKTATAHEPRPVVWYQPSARLLIASQAPGIRVHHSGRPFSDASGDRLRAWCGLSEDGFYDQGRVAIVPMAFCFPGYSADGADLPPPAICAKTWRRPVLDGLPNLRLTLLVGGAAMRWHLGKALVPSVNEVVANWRGLLEKNLFPLPHPSWRNTGWLKRNPWFEAELLPELQARIRAVME